MSIADLTNEPIELSIGGKVFKIKRMPIKDLLAPIQAEIISLYHANMKEASADLKGKDLVDFRLQALKSVPSKGELDALGMEYMLSPTGMVKALLKGLNECQPVTELEISDLLMKARMSGNIDELAFVLSYLTGEDAESSKKKLRMIMEQEPVEIPKA